MLVLTRIVEVQTLNGNCLRNIASIIPLIGGMLRWLEPESVRKRELTQFLRLVVRLKGAYEGISILGQYDILPPWNSLQEPLEGCKFLLGQLQKKHKNATFAARSIGGDLWDSKIQTAR